MAAFDLPSHSKSITRRSNGVNSLDNMVISALIRVDLASPKTRWRLSYITFSITSHKIAK